MVHRNCGLPEGMDAGSRNGNDGTLFGAVVGGFPQDLQDDELRVGDDEAEVDIEDLTAPDHLLDDRPVAGPGPAQARAAASGLDEEIGVVHGHRVVFHHVFKAGHHVSALYQGLRVQLLQQGFAKGDLLQGGTAADLPRRDGNGTAHCG